MSECRSALRPWDDAWNRPGMHRQGDSEMSPDTSRARTETEIRTLLDGHAAALRAKDPEGVVAHHAADFVQFSLAPPLRWKGANKSGLAAWFSTWNGPLGYERRETSIVSREDIAFCHGFVRLSGTKTDGTHHDIWFRQTIGLKRIDDEWKIVHEHDSVPFYMDGSLRAAVDLKP
jgi:ketosteroid isomerase-like protein